MNRKIVAIGHCEDRVYINKQIKNVQEQCGPERSFSGVSTEYLGS